MTLSGGAPSGAGTLVLAPRGQRTDRVLTMLGRLKAQLPKGERLPDKVWLRRHRVLVYLLWFHAVGLSMFGAFRGHGVAHSAAESSLLVVAALASNSGRFSRRTRSNIATLGILLSSALLVHFADGAIEAHFHYFVMLGAVSLYQDWMPFSLAVGFVLLNHGVLGALDPHSVYNHPAALSNPWKWAAIHALFVAGNSAVTMVYWRASEDRALRDSLTNLVNGTLFIDRLQQALAREYRFRRRAAVLFVDLDGFKAVNDRLGHAAGDRLLVEVAERIQSCLRSVDTAGRLGGDEFGVILEELNHPDDAVTVAERLLRCLQEPFSLNGTSTSINASIGIATSSSDGFAQGAPPGGYEHLANELAQSADAAMYIAKNLGRGRIQVFDPGVHASLLKRLELETDLEPAIQRGEFVLQFQPIVSLRTGDVTGVEALVRWQHPTRGLLPPSEFISLAERTGTIVPLGRWILAEACRRAREWQEEYPTDVPLMISVNVSACQFEDGIIVEDVRRAVQSSGLPPESLVLELTESVLVHGSETVLSTMSRLKEMGVRLAVDDFGTGYSSLNYLQSFPVDFLKIDRGFVHGLTQGPERSRFARAIIRLGTSLGLETIAEGIELEAEWTGLPTLGCDLGQGFYFAKPLDPGEIGDFLGRNYFARLVEERAFGSEAIPSDA